MDLGSSDLDSPLNKVLKFGVITTSLSITKISTNVPEACTSMTFFASLALPNNSLLGWFSLGRHLRNGFLVSLRLKWYLPSITNSLGFITLPLHYAGSLNHIHEYL